MAGEPAVASIWTARKLISSPTSVLLAWSEAFALAISVIGFTYFRHAKDDFESAL